MFKFVSIPELERITFFTGQQLTAADLTELQKANRELRWLHNRSLHNWGIGTGLGVTGERGSRAVTIEPGYGVDQVGREIILTEARSMAIPSVAGTPGGQEAIFYLVAAYLTDQDQQTAERREGVCLPEGTVRLREEPLVAWRRSDELQEGFELILAKAWVKNCQLSRPVCLAARRNARPSAQPYVASGQTGVTDTAWAMWKIGDQVLGVMTEVDTTAARFGSTPRYIAHVAGDRFLAESPGPLLAIGYPTTVEATPERFTLKVLLPSVSSVSGTQPDVNPQSLLGEEAPEIFNKLNWHVVWVGIEG